MYLSLRRTNLTEKGQQIDEYDPFANRDQESGASTGGALAHLLKSSLGTGILAMPMAFYNAGLLFGLIGTIIVGFLCTYCVHILVSSVWRSERKGKKVSQIFNCLSTYRTSYYHHRTATLVWTSPLSFKCLFNLMLELIHKWQIQFIFSNISCHFFLFHSLQQLGTMCELEMSL